MFFGGAAGGGKSYAQLIDALFFALSYPNSSQLILRRTYPELIRSLIGESSKFYPPCYKKSEHRYIFGNGSIIEFGSMDNETDVEKYQSAQYDIIRFDELSHFTEYQYLYMLSRVRGANGYPKQIKSTGNPGGVGHSFIKSRFIDAAAPGEMRRDEYDRSYVFIPSFIADNHFLTKSDPDYEKRLMQLPEIEKRRLLYGDWDIFEGRYFNEFDRKIHVISPFTLSEEYLRFRSIDYGLDMLACLWWAVDWQGRAYIYRELLRPGLSLSNAAKAVLDMSPPEEKIAYTVASPDLWNRRQETGYSGFQIMTEAGLTGLYKADNRRIPGFRALREWLLPFEDEFGIMRARLSFFDGACLATVSHITSLTHSKINPEDAANFPHEITHSCDSLRYGIMSRPSPGQKKPIYNAFSEDNGDELSKYLLY